MRFASKPKQDPADKVSTPQVIVHRGGITKSKIVAVCCRAFARPSRQPADVPAEADVPRGKIFHASAERIGKIRAVGIGCGIGLMGEPDAPGGVWPELP